jgi:hypothetical protein
MHRESALSRVRMRDAVCLHLETNASCPDMPAFLRFEHSFVRVIPPMDYQQSSLERETGSRVQCRASNECRSRS